jgi:hypothetical protein
MSQRALPPPSPVNIQENDNGGVEIEGRGGRSQQKNPKENP